MVEAIEQIQIPARVSEFPVAEIPAQPLEPQIPEPEPPVHDETALTAEITELWRRHTDHAVSMRNQSQSLRSLRDELGKKLAEMKQVLARPGRNGQWSGWLKERQIPRATADRLVAKHQRSLNPDRNRLTEAISEPTEEEIQTLVDKITPKLRQVLRTPTSVYRFVELLSASFEGVYCRVTEEGLAICRTAQQTAVVELASMEPQIEPVPVTIDVSNRR